MGSFGYPEWLHLVSFPDRAQETISQIQDIHAESGWSPGLLWEPEPVSPPSTKKYHGRET